MIRWCFMKFSFLTSRSAQNPGFKKEAATRVIINKMKPHPRQQGQGQMLHFHVDSLTSLQVEGDSQGKKHMTAKQRRCWGNWGEKLIWLSQQTWPDLILEMLVFATREEKKKKQKQEGDDTEEKTESSSCGLLVDQGSRGGAGASQQPLKRGQKVRACSECWCPTCFSCFFSLIKWRRRIITIRINTFCALSCVVSTEQAEEDQREVQRPGWRGQGADDAAAWGEDQRHTHLTQTCYCVLLCAVRVLKTQTVTGKFWFHTSN